MLINGVFMSLFNRFFIHYYHSLQCFIVVLNERPRRKVLWFEWFYILPFALVTCMDIAVFSDSFFDNTLADLPNSTRYFDRNNRYQLKVNGYGWQQVDIGTFSNGSADFEMKSAIHDAHIVVITHGINDSMDGVARFRMSNIAGDSVLSSCQETRRLVNKPLTVIAFIQCKDNSLLYSRMYSVRLFKTETGVVELYGYIGGNKKIQEQYAPQIQSIADSFLPL